MYFAATALSEYPPVWPFCSAPTTSRSLFQTISPGRFIQTTELDFDNVPQTVRMWQPVSTNPKYSLVPLILGSFLVALPATLIATLLGVATGIFLAEVAGKRTREVVKPAIELLAGIPSVVIGFFCLATLATLVQNAFHTTFRLNGSGGQIGTEVNAEDFKEQFEELTEELETLNAEARSLEERIAENAARLLEKI